MEKKDYSDWNTRKYFEKATVESVKQYLKAGAKVNAQNIYGETPLHHAARWSNNPEVIKVIVKATAKIDAQDENGRTPLHFAARWNNTAVVKVLLNAGANPNAENKYGDTPLHYAAEWNDAYVVKTLIKAGAKVNDQNKYGWTPLHSAAWLNENPEVIKALLKLGADPKAKDNRGKTAWDFIQDNEELKNTAAYQALKDLQ